MAVRCASFLPILLFTIAFLLFTLMLSHQPTTNPPTITMIDSTEPKAHSIDDISIRPVTADDLDAIVEIVIKAFPYDEQFAYRYPYREQYPEEHYKYTRLYYAEYLNTTLAGQNTIMLATAPDLKNPKETKVISLSIWDNPGDRAPDPDIPAVAPPKNHPERKDCNPARLKAYSEATMKARKDIFVSRFGERQLSLRQMATLPGYWKRGAASKLLAWGMERARKEGVAIPMFAGNMGKLLYVKFGFKELGRVKIQAPGESEVVYEIAMAWDPRDESGEVGKGSGSN